MKLSKFIFFVILCISAAANAFNVDGMISTSYEVYDDKGEDTEGRWENYLQIHDTKLMNSRLKFNFFGRYAREDDDSYTDIYSSYLEYSSFQKALEVKLGRFSYAGNQFLTLNGAEVTLRTKYYVGATVFGGSPEYFDADKRHINESFRDTGDRLYGTKVFMNGVKNTDGYISYSKEDNDSETLQELFGAGLGRRFVFSEKTYFSLDGKVEYDTEEDDARRGILRSYLKYHKLNLIADFTRYNVKDGSAYNEELVISNFSAGREDRYSFTFQYDFTQHVSVYQSTVRTVLEYPSGEDVTGEIYKMGLDVNYFQAVGITSNAEGYYYNSTVANAKGGSLAVDWSLTDAVRMTFEGELLRYESSGLEDTVYTLYLSGEYDIIKDLTLSIYGENNQETRYMPENRYGVKAVYSF